VHRGIRHVLRSRVAMSRTESPRSIPGFLWILLIVYCCASLIHFVHNAEFVGEYPNLPVWLTRSKVYLAWLAIAAVGAAGVALIKLGWRMPGFVFIAGYAALGFAGLDHYWVAPLSAHTLAMNATIGFEVVAAAVLFLAAIVLLLDSRRRAANGTA
jgi:hypothetical protein